jgi:hypothetical protein
LFFFVSNNHSTILTSIKEEISVAKIKSVIGVHLVFCFKKLLRKYDYFLSKQKKHGFLYHKNQILCDMRQSQFIAF